MTVNAICNVSYNQGRSWPGRSTGPNSPAGQRWPVRFTKIWRVMH